MLGELGVEGRALLLTQKRSKSSLFSQRFIQNLKRITLNENEVCNNKGTSSRIDRTNMIEHSRGIQ